MTDRPDWKRGDIVQLSDGRIGAITAVWLWNCPAAPAASHWRVKLMIDGHEWQYAASQIVGRATMRPRLSVIRGCPHQPAWNGTEPPSAA